MNVYSLGFIALVFVGYAIYYVVFSSKLKNRVIHDRYNSRSLLLPQAQSAYDALGAYDMNGCVNLLRDLRQRRQWSEFATTITRFGTLLDRGILDAAVDQMPNDALYYLLRGEQAIAAAWEARGQGVSSGVSKENANLFAQWMQIAEADFLHASKLDPEDPTPFAKIVSIVLHYKAQGTEEEAALHALQHAIHRNEDDYVARMAYWKYFCRTRWGGSPEKMRDFAARAAQGARLGNLRLTFMAEAHFDNWTHQLFFGTPQQASAYLSNPQAQNEVATSFANSVGSEYHVLGSASLESLNAFAMWFFALQDQERCRQAFERLGPDQFVPATWAAITGGTSTHSAAQFSIAHQWATAGGKYKILG